MGLNSKVILAETHSPEYLLHKYWARKPHNIISKFLEELLPEGGVVLDPFCGSGVVIREAQKLGIDSIGIDVNPIAILNTKVISNPLEVDKFKQIVNNIINGVEEKCSHIYSTDGKDTIRYLIHAIVVKCKKCNNNVSSNASKKSGKKNLCPKCGNELRFNLENMISSDITGCCVEGQKKIISDEKICTNQMKSSCLKSFDISDDEYNFEFEENRRILAYKGMHTKDLFTVRNYNILCYIASEFEKISDEKIRDAAMLLLTASVAQCSRLIPTRNNLSTGGPAWSVPGFWVPAQHLETNPILHLKARIRKFEKGLKNFKIQSETDETTIIKGNSIVEILKLDKKADLIFLDPPYGDNVPYAEYSTMWNSFLKEQPKLDDDISVSDRMTRTLAWGKYKSDINNILEQCAKIINPGGHLLITFNNNDIKAWEAFLGSLQKNGFVCDYLSYVIPSVVSSKAQFSPKGSYITDMYSVYSHDPMSKTSTSLESVTEALMRCASARKDGVAKNLLYRTIMIEWINKNIDSALLKDIPDIVNSLFKKKGDMMQYIGPELKCFDLASEVRKEAKAMLENGPCEWRELYKNIAEKFIMYGFLDSSELREYLSNNIIISKNKCISYKE